MTDTLYERDFVAWTESQAESLRRLAQEGSNLPLDWENLAEEIESVGRSQRSEIKSLVEGIVAHLLKMAHSPAVDRNWIKWTSEIERARSRLELALEDSPSLRPALPEMVDRMLPIARKSAVRALDEFGENAAISAVERDPLAITPEQVLEQGWYLPGTPPLADLNRGRKTVRAGRPRSR